MAKIVSFNTDAPGLKPKEMPKADKNQVARHVPTDDGFELQIAGDYLSFAGHRELRAYMITALKGSLSYTHELPDKAALLGLLLDVLKVEPNDASAFLERAERGAQVSLKCQVAEADLQVFGFVRNDQSALAKAAA